MTQFPDRIPYDSWINSQLSIAKFYGGCVLNGEQYVLDYDNCPVKIDPETQEERFFPDLVKMSLIKKKAKKRHEN